jgi:hypothetical protein
MQGWDRDALTLSNSWIRSRRRDEPVKIDSVVRTFPFDWVANRGNTRCETRRGVTPERKAYRQSSDAETTHVRDVTLSSGSVLPHSHSRHLSLPTTRDDQQPIVWSCGDALRKSPLRREVALKIARLCALARTCHRQNRKHFQLVGEFCLPLGTPVF